MSTPIKWLGPVSAKGRSGARWLLIAPCSNTPIGLFLSSPGAKRRTMVLPAWSQRIKAAAFGLRLGALLVCTGRR